LVYKPQVLINKTTEFWTENQQISMPFRAVISRFRRSWISGELLVLPSCCPNGAASLGSARLTGKASAVRTRVLVSLKGSIWKAPQQLTWNPKIDVYIYTVYAIAIAIAVAVAIAI
jgi:hypothetical protein